jgi:hypothetical protein
MFIAELMLPAAAAVPGDVLFPPPTAVGDFVAFCALAGAIFGFPVLLVVEFCANALWIDIPPEVA